MSDAVGIALLLSDVAGTLVTHGKVLTVEAAAEASVTIDGNEQDGSAKAVHRFILGSAS